MKEKIHNFFSDTLKIFSFLFLLMCFLGFAFIAIFTSDHIELSLLWGSAILLSGETIGFLLAWVTSFYQLRFHLLSHSARFKFIEFLRIFLFFLLILTIILFPLIEIFNKDSFLKTYLNQFSTFISKGYDYPEKQVSFVTALIIYFSAFGSLSGFFLTNLFFIKTLKKELISYLQILKGVQVIENEKTFENVLKSIDRDDNDTDDTGPMRK